MQGKEGFQKGEGGRKEGCANKITGSVKETILDVFNKMGGAEGLYAWATECATNKRLFYMSFMKMLPREVHVQNDKSPDALPFNIIEEKDDPKE